MLIQKLLVPIWGTLFAFSGHVQARAREHAPQYVWERMVRYTAYQAAAHAFGCRIPPFGSSLVREIDIPSTDTQATVFRDDKSKELIVGFPGTTSVEDELLNLFIVLVPFNASGTDLVKTCQGCHVHNGWLIIWNSISPTLVQTLQSELQTHPGYTITLTGHSLGGAVITLGYVALKSLGLPVTQAYSFGQPRVGNQAFATYFDKVAGATDDSIGEYWRITHADDLAPRIVPTILGFRHTRTELWQQNTTLGPEGHSGPDLTWRCFSQEPTDCVSMYGLALGSFDAHRRYTNAYLVGNYSCIGNI